ncbi:MAG: NAD-dependent epimerase/dehydratase family protein [Pseudomonadota bacterium]
MQQTVLILGGSGKIGAHTAAAFWNAGWSVRHFDRKTDDMVTAAQGVDVIVNGLNPPNYHNWGTLIPQITDQVIAAAKASGATVIIPGNIYNFGDQPGVFDEHTPQTAITRKGQIRIAMEEAYRASGVQNIVLRAGNFIDPDQNGDILSMLMLKKALKGKITTLGDPEAMQAYAYVPDWARAALALAEIRDSLAPFEDVPFPGHAFTTAELARHIAFVTGREMHVATFPWWAMSLLSPFWELAREFKEMRYLFNIPHEISGTKFHRLLPDFTPTPLDRVMEAGLPADVDPNQVMRASRRAIAAE